MRFFNLALIIATVFSSVSCSNSPSEKAHASVKSYLEQNLKIPSSYKPESFSKLDTLAQVDTLEAVAMNIYKITHFYTISNSVNDKIKMSVSFFLDKNFKVTEASTTSINGDYGLITGNAYWKFNDFVGNKADAGAEVILYSMDTIRGNLVFEATTDVQGNYKIENIPPGEYFLMVRSTNATDCPEVHLARFKTYSAYLRDIHGFDLEEYSSDLKEISVLDSLAGLVLTSVDYKNLKYGDAQKALDSFNRYSKLRREKANELINSFPDDFKRKIKLYTGYSYAYDFDVIYVEENKVNNHISDFGVTCI